MGGNMDEDTRQEFKHAREALSEVKSAVNAVGGKLDLVNQQFNTHLVEDARNFKGLEMQTAALHHRLDETDRMTTEKRTARVLLWLAVIGALATAVFALVADVLRHSK
jgi:hypothetical protein